VVVVMKINRKKLCPPSVGVCGGECQEVYECRSVQSAQEYMMYLDTARNI